MRDLHCNSLSGRIHNDPDLVVITLNPNRSGSAFLPNLRVYQEQEIYLVCRTGERTSARNLAL